jgi:hypothetical protein
MLDAVHLQHLHEGFFRRHPHRTRLSPSGASL